MRVWSSSAVAGRRYARRASVARIFDAHGASSAALGGRQMKMRRRLGESTGTRPLYGPSISSDEMERGALGTSDSRLQIGMRAGPRPSGLIPSDFSAVATTDRTPALS